MIEASIVINKENLFDNDRNVNTRIYAFSHGPSMFYIPDDVPRNPEALQVFVKNMAEDETLHHEDLKTHYQAAMNELRKVPEVQLLERVSAALEDNSTRLEILQPFHALCFNLLKQADVDVSSELRAVHDMEEEAADQHEQGKRCTSMENRQQDINCRGMCGKMCSCWWWVCGDCCYHQGCCEHDVCCNENPLSSFCLIPHVYGFSCSGFGGYPACKKKVGGHRIEAVGPARQNHGVSRLHSSIMTTLIRDLYFLLCFTVCFSVTTVFVKVVLLSNKSNVRNF